MHVHKVVIGVEIFGYFTNLLNNLLRIAAVVIFFQHYVCEISQVIADFVPHVTE